MKRLAIIGVIGFLSLTFQTVDSAVLNGSMRNNSNTCPWPLLNINQDDCTYNNSNSVLQSPPADPWVGPAPSSAFYSSTLGTGSPLPGDGKVSPGVTADITVGAGNVVSGTITIGAVAVHNFSAGATAGIGEETWVSKKLVLTPKAADAVNGTTLIIGDAGFPAYLQPDPGLSGIFGDEFTSEQGADSNGSTADVPYWEGPEPSGIGIATWETGGFIGGFTASIGTTATQIPSDTIGYSCVDTNLGTGGGGGACASESALHNRGEFENVLLKVFTDGAGGVTGVEGILVQEAVTPSRSTWVAWRFSVAAPANAVDDTYSVIQDSSNNILDVGANDINFEDPTEATISTPPNQSGTLLIQNSGGDPTAITADYTPAGGFAGIETFGYTMDDAVNSPDNATVTVTVFALGANDDTAFTGLNTPVMIPVGINDFGFTSPAAATITSVPTNGGAVVGNSPGDPLNITVDYTPNAGFEGIDTFQYTVDDSVIAPDTATVTINVGNLVPVAPDAALTTAEDAPENITIDDILGVDFGNLPSTVTISTSPGNGMATVDNSTGKWIILYAPNQYFAGADPFDYMIRDADNETVTGTINVTVGPALVPVATDNAFTLAPKATQAFDVRGDDVPGSGALVNHTVRISQDPSNGTATVGADNRIEYTPDAFFSDAQDLLQYTLEDENGDVSAPADVVITVTPFSNKQQLPSPSVSAADPWSLVCLSGMVWLLRRKRRMH